MLFSNELFADLAANGLGHWDSRIRTLLDENLRDGAHGRLEEWKAILRELPDIRTGAVKLDQAAVAVSGASNDDQARSALRQQLLKLSPWRKGPFDICGVGIDSEWRSDLKWSRIGRHVTDLADRLVLDVGAGNGYYALRMRGAGARCVIGIEPTLQYLMQFLAVQRYARQPAVHLLPGRLADLPAPCQAFDSTFSMGVLYHQRNPLEHLQQLHATLKPGGELVLETLILPGEHNAAVSPSDRYARMRNVWLLPTLPMLIRWLAQSGFDDVRVVDVSITTIDEQRSTEWMPFESLQQALDTSNTDLTIEGWPRPCRAALVAIAAA